MRIHKVGGEIKGLEEWESGYSVELKLHPVQLFLDHWRSVTDPICSLYGFIFLTNCLILCFLLQ